MANSVDPDQTRNMASDYVLQTSTYTCTRFYFPIMLICKDQKTLCIPVSRMLKCMSQLVRQCIYMYMYAKFDQHMREPCGSNL